MIQRRGLRFTYGRRCKEMISNYWRGISMAFGTALLWGAMSPISKIIASMGLSPITVMCYRAVFIVLVMGCWLYLKRGPESFVVSKHMLMMYVLIGLLTLVFNASGFMMSCAYLSVPKALILHYTFPLVTMAGSVSITREKPSVVQVLSGFLVIFGLYVGFLLGGGSGGDISTAGVLWGMLSVLGLSGQTLISRRLLKSGTSDPMVQLFFIHLFGGAILIIGKSLLSGWSDLAVMTPALFALIQYPAVASGLIGFGLLFTSLKYISASSVSLICTLEIVFALLLTPFLLHQVPTAYELVGCMIVLISVACSMLGNGRQDEQRTANKGA